jgi:SpoVK/Ycf46/Vps4 family AAA+-type ATPase
MTSELEDPRKGVLRERCETAVDAAGFTVLADRPDTAWPDETQIEGALLGDVVGADGAGNRDHYFVRVDGTKPLPDWLATATEGSFSLEDTRVIVVAEEPDDLLVATCKSAGAGLAKLTSADRLEVVLEYGPPDRSALAEQFRSRLRDVRRKLDTKLRLNESRLEQSFRDSAAVTSEMAQAKRDDYLTSIEKVMLVWRKWGEEMSDRLDKLAATEDLDELELIEKEVTEGPKT